MCVRGGANRGMLGERRGGGDPSMSMVGGFAGG